MTPQQIQSANDANAIPGMAQAHFESLQNLAQKRGEVIVIRPVSEWAGKLIEENYPTKSFHVKGKSADWGPQAGFIPVDQSLSKIKDPVKAAASSEGVNEVIAKHAAFIKGEVAGEERPNQVVEAAPLVISADRLKELEQKKAINTPVAAADGRQFLSVEHQGQIHSFCATPKPDGRFLISKVEDNLDAQALVERVNQKVPIQMSEVKVVGTRLPGQDVATPLTADYDVLAVAPKLENYGQPDRVQIPEVDRRKLNEKITHLQANDATKASGDALKAASQDYDHDRGNVSNRLLDFINDARKEFSRGDGLDMIHHGADTHNPVADLPGDFDSGGKMAVFLPEDLTYQNSDTGNTETLPRGVYTVDSLENLNEVLHTLRENGFQVPRNNPAWTAQGIDPSSLTRLPGYQAAKAAFESNLPGSSLGGGPGGGGGAGGGGPPSDFPDTDHSVSDLREMHEQAIDAASQPPLPSQLPQDMPTAEKSVSTLAAEHEAAADNAQNRSSPSTRPDDLGDIKRGSVGKRLQDHKDSITKSQARPAPGPGATDMPAKGKSVRDLTALHESKIASQTTRQKL